MKYKLKEISNVSSSKRIYAKEYTPKGIPFYRGKEIIAKSQGYKVKDSLFISIDKFKELKENYDIPKANDILISAVGTIGKIYLVRQEDLPFYFKDGNLIKVTVNNEKNIDTNYLYYYLTSSIGQEKIKDIEIGSTQKAITIKSLSDIEVDLPSLATQKQISSRLLKIDEKVKLNNQINDNLVELVDSYFINFLNNVTTVEKTIEDIGTVVGGGTPSKKIAAYWNGDIAWVTPKDLSQHPLIFTSSGENYITGLGLAKGSAKLLPTNTILFSSRAPIGYISIAKNNLATNQGFKSVIPNKEYSFQFIYELLKHETAAIKNEANGSTFKEISGKKLKQHIINIPNSEDTSKFNEITKPIFKQLRKLEEENEKLLAIKKELLEKYF